MNFEKKLLNTMKNFNSVIENLESLYNEAYANLTTNEKDEGLLYSDYLKKLELNEKDGPNGSPINPTTVKKMEATIKELKEKDFIRYMMAIVSQLESINNMFSFKKDDIKSLKEFLNQNGGNN